MEQTISCPACGGYIEGINVNGFCGSRCAALMAGSHGDMVPRLVWLIQSLRCGQMAPGLAIFPVGEGRNDSFKGPNLGAIPKNGALIKMQETAGTGLKESPFHISNTIFVKINPIGRGAPANLDKAEGFSRFSLVIVEEAEFPGSISGVWDLTLYQNSNSYHWEILQMRCVPEKEGPMWQKIDPFFQKSNVSGD